MRKIRGRAAQEGPVLGAGSLFHLLASFIPYKWFSDYRFLSSEDSGNMAAIGMHPSIV